MQDYVQYLIVKNAALERMLSEERAVTSQLREENAALRRNLSSKENKPLDPSLLRQKNKFVEHRFTVGSLVWARMEGWPAWPGMVDDDPDTGEFFWTEVRGGEWVPMPSSYHVVFFDSKDKAVSRAWVADRKVERFVLGDKVKGPRSDNRERLQGQVPPVTEAEA